MMATRSTLSIKMKSINRMGKSIQGFSQLRALSTGAGPSGNKEKEIPSGKKTGLYAIGGIAALGGIAYAYRVLNNDKYDPLEPVRWAREALGLSPPTPGPRMETSAGKETILTNLTEANCAGKEDCAKDDKCGDSACLRKMDKEEEMIAKANSELEKALKEVKPRGMEATETALKAYCEAVDVVKTFMEMAYCAIEEDSLESPRFEELWCEVYDMALKRCEKVKEAIAKGQCAWEFLCRLREIIENGKNCKYTSCNPLLVTAEETLLCAERELLNAKAKMDCVQSESRLVEQYKSVIEDFRRDLKGEVESLLTTNGECRSNLTENECSMILTHAYKKVLRVQKELALVQAKGIGSNLIRDFKIPEAEEKLEEIRVHYENELVKALARQSQVHYDSMEQIKDSLRTDFQRRLQQKADLAESGELVELRSKYVQAKAVLASMRKVLSDRKSDEDRSEGLRRLWTFSSALYNKIHFGEGKDSSSIPIPKDVLMGEYGGDSFSLPLLQSFPDTVESIGSLRSRFFNSIDRTCRNVGVFREGEQLSLGKYIWGVIQGSLTSRCEGSKESVGSIYEILDKTAFHLRRGELLEAVLTLNQTEGPARVVCEDWLSDARGVLETSQTLSALMTHANGGNHLGYSTPLPH